MAHLLQQLITPHAVLMLFIWGTCLLGNVYPAYRDGHVGFRVVPLFWLIVGILALISWVVLVFLR